MKVNVSKEDLLSNIYNNIDFWLEFVCDVYNIGIFKF